MSQFSIKEYIILTLLFFIPLSAFSMPACETAQECDSKCTALLTPDKRDEWRECLLTCESSASFDTASCDRTYYFCSYNTFASDYNWLEISNLSDEKIVARVFILDNLGKAVNYPLAGEVPGDILFNLNPFVRGDFSIHDEVGPNKFGQAVIVLDGLDDNISAGVSYYKNDAGDLDQKAHSPCIKKEGSNFSSLPVTTFVTPETAP